MSEFKLHASIPHEVSVRSRKDEVDLPLAVKEKLRVLRQELTSLRRALEPRNAEIKRLKRELRLAVRAGELKALKCLVQEQE